MNKYKFSPVEKTKLWMAMGLLIVFATVTFVLFYANNWQPLVCFISGLYVGEYLAKILFGNSRDKDFNSR